MYDVIHPSLFPTTLTPTSQPTYPITKSPTIFPPSIGLTITEKKFKFKCQSYDKKKWWKSNNKK
jgi:hypothetical protein